MARTMRRVFLLMLILTAISACNLEREVGGRLEPIGVAQVATATETIPPYTPLPSLTPSPTLRPPPTFEPATPTLPPTAEPSQTPAPTLNLSVSIPGLNGAETPTPTTTPGCEPRKDWKLRYTVKFGDALARIAEFYSTTVSDLVVGNCLTDANVITEGQELHVPGEVQPVAVVECPAWEVMTPMDNTVAIPGEGQMTFNWRGPRGIRNLIRVVKPDGGWYEKVVELRQNETIDLTDIPLGGTYTWYVYPLDENFVQIPCKEGGPWTFYKEAQPPTPTPFSLGP